MQGKLFVMMLCCSAAVANARFADVVRGPMAEKGPDDVPALIEALKDDTLGTRWNAALLLGDIGEPAAVPALIECAAGDENARVRRRAFEALGKLGDRAAVPTLIEALDDEDRFVRRDAARALGVLGDKSAVPALIETLKDLEGFVRRDAARALGGIGDPKAVPALQKLTGEGPEAFSTDAPLMPDEMSPVAREAYFALGKIGGDTALPALKAVSDHISVAMRVRAAGLLGRLGPDAAETLTGMLSDDNVDVRRAAVAALKEIGGDAGVERLVGALDILDVGNDHVTVRDAIDALGEVGDASAVPALRELQEKCREHSSRYVRRLVRNINATVDSIEE